MTKVELCASWLLPTVCAAPRGLSKPWKYVVNTEQIKLSTHEEVRTGTLINDTCSWIVKVSLSKKFHLGLKTVILSHLSCSTVASCCTYTNFWLKWCSLAHTGAYGSHSNRTQATLTCVPACLSGGLRPKERFSSLHAACPAALSLLSLCWQPQPSRRHAVMLLWLCQPLCRAAQVGRGFASFSATQQ